MQFEGALEGLSFTPSSMSWQLILTAKLLLLYFLLLLLLLPHMQLLQDLLLPLPLLLLLLLLFLQYVHLLLLLHLIFPRTSFIPIQYQAKELVDNNVSAEDNFFNGNAVEQVSSFQKALLTWCIKGL